ncbi:MAG: hypothetical protein HOV71_19595 [Hamadaea sp.]|uniref:hypothetical protein n=1 Tax=Hamadaea sp. TaxID=2024425 RepID=UPI0017B120BD|nr:hypothetical protein [Hamadaea sp.]NUR50335.1 hypothetical protein [Hamadaea sp.]NUR70058.1 hypothetical protein [Hamadaea sp.]NUT21602.1 hypothetical protein [Hamadaea sp.]
MTQTTPVLRPPAPGPRPQTLLWVLLGALPLLIAIGYASGVLLAKRANAIDAEARHRPSAAALAPSASVSRTPSPSPVPAPTWLTSTKAPVLRPVTGKPVLGPAYVDRDTTYTAAFPGWPFAFRLPDGWNCVNGDTLRSAPAAYRKVCVDELTHSPDRAVVLSLLRCERDCTTARMRALALSWLAQAGTPVRDGTRTWHVETPQDGKGLWVLDLAHVFTWNGDDYLVVLYANMPPAEKDVALKIVNDIVAQAG